MRAKGAIAELLDTGLYVKATNPWTGGKLAKLAKELGFTVKSITIVRKSVPWSKSRLYLSGMTSKQLDRVAKFIDAIIEGREKGEIGEGKPAPRYIRMKFGRRKPRVYVSKAKPLETLRAELTKIREAMAVAPTAPVGRELA